jgi:hypothetical protein
MAPLVRAINHGKGYQDGHHVLDDFVGTRYRAIENIAEDNVRHNEKHHGRQNTCRDPCEDAYDDQIKLG